MSSKAKDKAKFARNTAAEESRIKAGIKADPDTRELAAKDFSKLIPFPEMVRRRGRPKAARHKVPVTLRLEPEVVEHFRREGRGWQTRINDALVRYVARRHRDDD
ncbi:MAG: BrnA antitoxin family protein [Steroidobacteraceae bacterium]